MVVSKLLTSCLTSLAQTLTRDMTNLLAGRSESLTAQNNKKYNILIQIFTIHTVIN